MRMKDAGPIRTRRHCPPKDDHAEEGRGLLSGGPERLAWAPARLRPGRTPAARPREAPGIGTGAPTATAQASRLSSAGPRSGVPPAAVMSPGVMSPAARAAQAPRAEPCAVCRSCRPTERAQEASTTKAENAAAEGAHSPEWDRP